MLANEKIVITDYFTNLANQLTADSNFNVTARNLGASAFSLDFFTPLLNITPNADANPNPNPNNPSFSPYSAWASNFQNSLSAADARLAPNLLQNKPFFEAIFTKPLATISPALVIDNDILAVVVVKPTDERTSMADALLSNEVINNFINNGFIGSIGQEFLQSPRLHNNFDRQYERFFPSRSNENTIIPQ
jgi:hypothetical protein